MSEWIKLDPGAFSARARQVKMQNGVEIALSLSPYDVPDAVRGNYDPKSGRFLVEFSYIEDEAWVKKQHDQNIELRVGRNSGRLYGIEIDIDSMKASQIALKIELPKIVGRAIDDELRQANRQSRRENYQIAKSVISEEREPLFAQLVGP